MDASPEAYVASYLAACAVALGIAMRHGGRYAVFQRRYWHFLAQPWKLATFVVGTAAFTLVAPYTGDPTWDRVDGFFMSVSCFATAPWVVATLYFDARGELRAGETYVAVCAWLFSASWSYDLYLLWRDGHYPATWHANLVASSVIYLCAGLFWNLEHDAGRGVIFSFMRAGWPSRPHDASVGRLVLWGAVFAIPAIAAVAMFLL
jgi:hypothetical protein